MPAEGADMNEPKGRREFMQLVGLGGVVFASGLAGACTNILRKSGGQEDDFFFVQLSDSHWGFKGPPNPEAANTLRQAVAAVNALSSAPDFVVFTGDLTHTTDDEAERRKRMREFKAIVADLKTPVQHYMPGEHDASLTGARPIKRTSAPHTIRLTTKEFTSRCWTTSPIRRPPSATLRWTGCSRI
jgi:predicted MPP superfamily phosphohydrolase